MPSAPIRKSNGRGYAPPPPPPAPGLKRLSSRVKVTEDEPAPSSGAIPIVKVEGDTMKRYNEAAQAMKEAEATLKDLRPILCAEALERIFGHNCDVNCLQPLTSVKLQDVTYDENLREGDVGYEINGEVTRVSFTAKYNSCDTASVEAVFAEIATSAPERGIDINHYVAETLKADFDDKVFLDKDGNFDKAVYDKFRVAIERVARELNLRDAEGMVNSPLKTKRVLHVKPDFHALRFKDFNPDENIRLTEVLPNTIQCVAVRTV